VRKQTTLSKRGNSRLRKAFYFPAVSAMTWNPLIKAHYERLRGKGKPKMVALAACMRKLLMICYGVLKHQKPFDAQWEYHSTGHPSSKQKEPVALQG
jgi:transposase